jgi:hypothetical protein
MPKTRTTDNIALEIEFILEDIGHNSTALTSPCSIDLIIRTHDGRHIRFNSFGEWPEIQLDQG